MKRLLIITLIVLTMSGVAHAGSWSINCVNDSCVAEQGALKIHWSAEGRSLYYGKLTGVEGIPINIEDYQAAEKKVESVIEKSITLKKSSDTGVKGDAPDGLGGPSAGVTGSKENLFTKKRSMSQSKTKGKKISVDYTLAFIEWLGDTRFGWDSSIKRYWSAAEYALDSYKNGSIEDVIEGFFIARNAGDLAHIDVDSKINDENKNLVLIKYLGLVKFPGMEDAKQRYALASGIVADLSTNKYMEEAAAQITKEFNRDIASLKILSEPGQTAEKLYKKDKNLAFAKWLADNHKFIAAIDKLPAKDKYIIAANVVNRYNNNVLDAADMEYFTTERQNFETAIKNKDKSVQIVTIKSKFPVIPIAGVVGVGILIGVIGVVNRRKNNNQQEAERERP
jgi:hypothetical protein